MEYIYFVMLYFAGKLLVEMKYDKLISKYVFRIFGTIALTVGLFGWLTPTQPNIATAIFCSVMAVLLLGYLAIKTKSNVDRTNIINTILAVIGAFWGLNQIPFIVVSVLMIITATYFERKW